mgnify:CR=1 FL=1
MKLLGTVYLNGLGKQKQHGWKGMRRQTIIIELNLNVAILKAIKLGQTIEELQHWDGGSACVCWHYLQR